MKLFSFFFSGVALVGARTRGLWLSLVYRPIFQSAPGLRIYGSVRFKGYFGQIHLGVGSRWYGMTTVVFNDEDSYGRLEAGRDLVIENGCVLAARGGIIEMGDDCFLGDGVIVQSFRGSSIQIGSHVMIAKGACLYASNHCFDRLDVPMKHQGEHGKGIRVGDDVWIGANAVVLDGVLLGEGAIVAAGAVVNQNVAPRSIVGGVPAQVIGYRNP
jgi:acetyltransferase-like isoleucine patch superfamily enzyme